MLISSTEKLNKHTRKIQNRPSVTGRPVPCDDAKLQVTAGSCKQDPQWCSISCNTDSG